MRASSKVRCSRAAFCSSSLRSNVQTQAANNAHVPATSTSDISITYPSCLPPSIPLADLVGNWSAWAAPSCLDGWFAQLTIQLLRIVEPSLFAERYLLNLSDAQPASLV